MEKQLERERESGMKFFSSVEELDAYFFLKP